MEAVFHSLRPFIRFVVRRAPWVLALAVLLTGAGLYHASQLRVDTDFSKLIPSDYESVRALERLRATVGGESEMAVVIESPSFEANKAFAEALIPRALEMRRTDRNDTYFTRVDYRRDTEFIEKNALYFATPEELDELEDYLEDQIEEARLAANPFFFDLEDEDDDEFADDRGRRFENVYNRLVVTEYPISSDSTAMVLRFYPTGSQTNIGYIENAYADMQALIREMDPSVFHGDMEVVLAGRLLRQLTEVQTITEDVISSFGAGAMAVLIFVLLYFLYKAYTARVGRQFSRRVLLSELARVPAMAALIGIPLVMSLAWTFGVASVMFGTLNLMTSTLGLVLFGLGIDYGIHFYARYSEERGRGRSVMEAAEITFTSTGQAITVGALTTAAALYVLVVADFKGFSEFGFIAGTGIVFALIAMTVVMPAMLATFERLRLINLTTYRPHPSAPSHGRLRMSRGIIGASVVAVVAAFVFLPRVEFEYDFGSLEPTYEAFNEVNDRARRVPSNGGGRRNPAYVVVDRPEEVPAIVEALRRKQQTRGEESTIGDIEALQDRYPVAEAEQWAKIERIERIRILMEDPFLQASDSEQLARIRRAAQTAAPIAVEDVPEYLKKQFTSRSGEIGNFVLIYPSVGLSDGRNSMAFAAEVGEIVTADGTVYHAGSTSIVAADMLRLMQAEAPWMVLATFLIVMLLMLANFRSIRWAALAVVPLIVGVLWMLLLMEVFGLKLNFYNLVVLPAILGIGNDAGVHLVHRFREEGPGSLMYVIRSTGEHVAMGSMTTMIGFAGLMLSFHPGLRSIGELAVVGIGTTLLAALLFLPAMLQWREDRMGRAGVAENDGHASEEVPGVDVARPVAT
jgi:uncharacterized protein